MTFIKCVLFWSSDEKFSSNIKNKNKSKDRNVLQTKQNYKFYLHVNYCHKIKSHDYTVCHKGLFRDN